MLTLSQLHDIPDELANRMMVAHGSRKLLRALRGEPEPVETFARIPKRPEPKRRRYTPVSARTHKSMPSAVQRIVEQVAAEFGVSTDELCGAGRSPYLVRARSVAYRLLRDRLHTNGEAITSFPRIAGYFGRDHSTVCYAINHFADYCRHHPQVADAYAKLRGGQ